MRRGDGDDDYQRKQWSAAEATLESKRRMCIGIRPRAPHPFQGFVWSTVTRTADMFPAR